MARAPRQFVAGGIYHVYSRGSNRQAIFTFDTDRIDFLDCLDGVVKRTNLRCFAYCLMSNHYHLVLKTGDGELSRAVQRLNGRYALRFNRRYDRDAHLFKNRFRAVPQETESQLIWTLRYIVMNPVVTGLCGAPEEWRWSSYRASAGIDEAPRFLDVSGLLSLFGNVSETSRAQYRAYVQGLVGV